MAVTLASIAGTPYAGGNTPGYLHIRADGIQEITKSNHSAVVAPTALDDTIAGYKVGSRWTDILTRTVYECVSAAMSAAVWKDLSTTSNPGGSSGQIQYNNSGLWGGVTGSSVDGSDITIAGKMTLGSDQFGTLVPFSLFAVAGSTDTVPIIVQGQESQVVSLLRLNQGIMPGVNSNFFSCTSNGGSEGDLGKITSSGELVVPTISTAGAVAASSYSATGSAGVFSSSVSDSNRRYAYFGNNNVGGQFGIEGAAGTTFTGTTANSVIAGCAEAKSLHLATGGIVRLTIDSAGATTIPGTMSVGNVIGPSHIRGSSSSTVPSFVPNEGDGNTGIGWAGSDLLSLITGGSESGRLDVSDVAGETRFLLYDVDTALLQRVKVGANGTGPGGVGRALYIAAA